VHQTEGQVECLAGAEHAVVRPDGHIVFFHQFAGRDADIASAGNHPADHTHAVREDDRALGGHFPQLSRKDFVLQRKHEGKGDDVRCMRMIDDTVPAVCHSLLHFVVQKMCRQFAGRQSAFDKSQRIL
jgi:hypothetical protein